MLHRCFAAKPQKCWQGTQLLYDVKSPFFDVGFHLVNSTIPLTHHAHSTNTCFGTLSTLLGIATLKKKTLSSACTMRRYVTQLICSGWCDSMRPNSFTVVPVMKSWKQEKHTATNGRGKSINSGSVVFSPRGGVSESGRKGETRGRDTVWGEAKSTLLLGCDCNFLDSGWYSPPEDIIIFISIANKCA